jgi:hypothetical protein
VRMASVPSSISSIFHFLCPHQRLCLLYDTSPRAFLIIGTPDSCCWPLDPRSSAVFNCSMLFSLGSIINLGHWLISSLEPSRP